MSTESNPIYTIGETYEFKVRRVLSNACEVIDEQSGITSYLQGTANLFLVKGQIVKCRVLAFAEKHPQIELVNINEFEQSTKKLTEDKLNDLLENRGFTCNFKDFIKLLLADEAEKSFETQLRRWVQNLINKKVDLGTVRSDCSSLLEMSELLNICKGHERDFYQERLTLIIEQLGYYIKADILINNENIEGATDTPNSFVDNLLTKLRVSGFVYHPNKNFNILSSLFQCKPQLMNDRIKELLDIISEKNLEIWKREPFSSALINLLEFYIRECEGKFDRTKDKEQLLDNNLRALAIQLLLLKESKEETIADKKLSSAKLCLLYSYQMEQKKKLIDAALLNLLQPEVSLPNYTLQQTKLLPYYIANSAEAQSINTTSSFTKGNGRLSISPQGIQLCTISDNAKLKSVLPKELGLWQNMQILLPAKLSTNLAVTRNNAITPYQEVWKEIETEFFNIRQSPHVANKNSKKHQHDVGEYVRIFFTHQDVSDRCKYYCQIENEPDAVGFIYIEDIAQYAKNISSLRHFFDPSGKRYVFQALIKGQENGLFQFSMKEDLQKYFTGEDGYGYEEDIICSVGGSPNSKGMAPAVSTDGVSVSIINAAAFDGVERNSIVKCRLVGPGDGTFHIKCEMIDFDSCVFDLTTAFKELLDVCACGKIPESIEAKNEDQLIENDNVLDESYVKLIICLIDRMASIDPEYVKSYNYLGFARVLCLLIGWESQAVYYKGRMDIIVMLHDFAVNSKIDEEKLTELENANEELFSNNAVLKERFLQLQTISYINKQEHSDKLMAIANTYPALKNLASLVFAHNVIKQNALDGCATDVHNKIIQLLNLKGYESGLKQYGDGIESEEIEYKTSILYSAEDSRLDKQMQMDEILKVINSFLNTGGGTLYIGVNDCGKGVGIEPDLSTPEFYGDKDKYIRTIQDAVACEWGNAILAAYVDVGFDKDNSEKDIVIVTIKKHSAGISYKGSWYVRKGSTKRRLTQGEFASYNQNRSAGLHAELTEQPRLEEKTTSPKQDLGTVRAKSSAPTSNDSSAKIQTSRIRPNVLAPYDEDYVEPISLFKFLPDGKFKRLEQYDYDDTSLLTLSVTDDERTGYLVLGYDSGHIVKIPIEELLGYGSKEYCRNTESNLIFASIAHKEDAIITISKGIKPKSKVTMRADSIDHFPEDKLTSKGVLPYDSGLVKEILAYDIVPACHKEDFKRILDLKKTTLGETNGSSTKDMVNYLHLHGITEI